MSKDVWQGDYTRPQSFNGWAYVEGDPINHTDPTGWRKYRIWASAFIPNARITFPHRFNELPGIDLQAEWHGDNRSFAWGDATTVFNESYSARVWHEMVIDADPSLASDPIIYNDSNTGRTEVYYSVFGSPRYATDKAPAPNKAAISRDGCSIKIVFMVSAPAGSNPLERDALPPAPPIDYAYYLRFDLGIDQLYISGYYDKFPAHELYIASETGPSLALVQAMPSGATGTPLDLASLPILIQPVTVPLP